MVRNFKDETWVEIFDAIEEEGILLWMWLVSDALELSEKLLTDLSYSDKIDELKQIFFRRRIKKKFSISDTEVREAIKKSIQNCFIWLKLYRKDFRYSEWLLPNSEAKNICQKYDNVLNPLLYMFLKEWDAFPIVKSLFQDENLNLEWYWVKNWYSKTWLQRYRSVTYMARRWIFYVINSEKILTSLYHPVVWYLLWTHNIWAYIDEEFEEEMVDYIKELTKLQTTKSVSSKDFIK